VYPYEPDYVSMDDKEYFKERDMSLSNPTKSNNPAQKFIKFNDGKWIYYDKQEEKNIELKLPAYFIILDELTTITGWSDSLQSYLYSNEIHNFKEQLTVKSFKGGLSIVGIYQDIKPALKDAGGQYCKSVYAMMFDKDMNTEMVNIKFTGSSLGPFIEANIKIDNQSFALMSEMIPAKKGKVDYFIPTLKVYKINEELKQEAIQMDIELQKYFKVYKAEKEIITVDKTETQDEPPLDVYNAEAEAEMIDNPENYPPAAQRNDQPNVPQEEDSELPF